MTRVPISVQRHGRPPHQNVIPISKSRSFMFVAFSLRGTRLFVAAEVIFAMDQTIALTAALAGRPWIGIVAEHLVTIHPHSALDQCWAASCKRKLVENVRSRTAVEVRFSLRPDANTEA